MYRHSITVELTDDLVHARSIMEWEEVFLHSGVIQRDELPLSFSRIAEILAEEYHKYGMPYFNNAYGTSDATSISIKETTNTTYTDTNGNSINTRIKPATIPQLLGKSAAVFMSPPDEPDTMQIGISRYGRKPPAWDQSGPPSERGLWRPGDDKLLS